MPSTSLQELFSGLACFDDLQRREVTVEANPETLAADFCGEPWATLSTLPVTRMSFGIQSLRQPILDRLERTHSVAHSLSALSVFSKQTRFRWSGDFIYAVPGLSQEDWLEDLSQYLSYGPTHVSAYQLTLTPGHPLYSKLPSADESALWFEATRETLRRSGLSPYETSNFAATDGDRCQHNVNYWRNNYFVGIGAGAASYAPVGRYGCTSKNLSDPNQYMQCVESGKLPAQWDSPLSERTAAEQTLLMGLRLSEGIESASFHERYPGVELSSRVLFELKSRKILSDRADRIQLTQAGQAVCDSVVLRLSAGLNPKIKGYQQVAQTPLG
jgi:oxygen-independent coproporphyrinogen-3 oxidase